MTSWRATPHTCRKAQQKSSLPNNKCFSITESCALSQISCLKENLLEIWLGRAWRKSRDCLILVPSAQQIPLYGRLGWLGPCLLVSQREPWQIWHWKITPLDWLPLPSQAQQQLWNTPMEILSVCSWRGRTSTGCTCIEKAWMAQKQQKTKKKVPGATNRFARMTSLLPYS